MPTLTAPLQRITEDDLVIDDIRVENTKPWIVWWHIGLYKNRQAYSEPKVHVAFYELNGTELSEKPILRSVPLTQLGRMRIGTVWLHGKIIQAAQFEERILKVSFNEEHWRFTSCRQPYGGRPPFPDALHSFWNGMSDSWLVEFDLPSAGRLVIPCLEILARTYGRSQEAKRVLTTYPWQGIVDLPAKERLLPSIEEQEEDHLWKIRLPDRLVKGDAVFLAHLKYDEYAQKAAKQIHAQLEGHYSPTGKRPLFIKVRPWFRGQVQIKVRGYQFDNSFLGLQIVGCSEPRGKPVICIRYGEDLESETEKSSTNQNNLLTHQKIQSSRILEVTGDTEPDRGRAPRVLTEDSFETLGEPRALTHKGVSGSARGLANILIRHPRYSQTEVDTASGAEPYGSGKDTRHGLIHAPYAMESKGVLRDMWNALRERQAREPGSLTELAWFTFQDGFQADAEPKLIPLRAIADQSIETRVRHWVYSDIRTKACRGVLVIRACIDGQEIFFIEIERRSKQMSDNFGSMVIPEENLKGLIFRLNNPADLRAWLSCFLSDIRFEVGIVSRLAKDCPGVAAAFSHTTNPKKDSYLYESALGNALKKINRPIKEYQTKNQISSLK